MVLDLEIKTHCCFFKRAAVGLKLVVLESVLVLIFRMNFAVFSNGCIVSLAKSSAVAEKETLIFHHA